ncbi:hypothetical protein NLN85_22105, partial [Citrobacter portucalensis]|uniref:hypothetical protein n=1 Tax=Citrobacter portucalensis TaxID=1639133 RepID=UPI00226BA448
SSLIYSFIIKQIANSDIYSIHSAIAQTIYSITLIAALNIPARYLSASLKKQATASHGTNEYTYCTSVNIQKRSAKNSEKQATITL